MKKYVSALASNLAKTKDERTRHDASLSLDLLFDTPNRDVAMKVLKEIQNDPEQKKLHKGVSAVLKRITDEKQRGIFGTLINAIRPKKK